MDLKLTERKHDAVVKQAEFHNAYLPQAGLHNTYLPHTGQNGQTYKPYSDSQGPNSYKMHEMPSPPNQQLYPSELPGLQR